jgi:hypothetical protein
VSASKQDSVISDMLHAEELIQHDKTAAKGWDINSCIVCCITSSMTKHTRDAAASLHYVGAHLVTYCLIKAIQLAMTASLHGKRTTLVNTCRHCLVGACVEQVLSSTAQDVLQLLSLTSAALHMPLLV